MHALYIHDRDRYRASPLDLQDVACLHERGNHLARLLCQLRSRRAEGLGWRLVLSDLFRYSSQVRPSHRALGGRRSIPRFNHSISHRCRHPRHSRRDLDNVHRICCGYQRLPSSSSIRAVCRDFAGIVRELAVIYGDVFSNGKRLEYPSAGYAFFALGERLDANFRSVSSSSRFLSGGNPCILTSKSFSSFICAS